MAWNAVDYRKCRQFQWRIDASCPVVYSGDGTTVDIGTSALRFAKGSDRVHAMRRLTDGTIGADEDWEIRYEYIHKGGDSWHRGAGVKLGSHFGNAWDIKTNKGRTTFEDVISSTNFHVNIAIVDSTGGSVARPHIETVVDDIASSTYGTIGLVTGTRYYITVSYDANGGAGGIHKITVVARTVSHGGSIFFTTTHEFGSGSDTHDLICFEPLCSGELWDAGYSDKCYYTIANIETDFDHGSDDQSDGGEYDTYDLTTFTEVDTPDNFDAYTNLLDNYSRGGGSANEIDRDSDDSRFYIDLGATPEGPFTMHCGFKASGATDFFFAGMLTLCDQTESLKELIDASGNAIGTQIYFDALDQRLAIGTEIVAGSDQSSNISSGRTMSDKRLSQRVYYDPDDGANGSLLVWLGNGQHPELMPWVYKSNTHALTAAIPSTLRYFFAYQNWELNSGAHRYNNVDIYDVYGTWLEDTTPPGISSLTINTSGDLLTIVADENVVGTPAGFSITVDGSSVTLSSGAISNTDITYTIDIPVFAGQTCLLSYTGSDIEDEAGNPLAAFSDSAITNSSGVVVPSSGRAARHSRYATFGYRS